MAKKVLVETEKNVDPSIESFTQKTIKKIKENIGLTMKVELKAPNSIPRSQGGKLSRIIDKR